MRFAIFSDLHNNLHGLQRTLQDAEKQNVDQLICLGDVGMDRTLFDQLQQLNAVCICGNWEVSGWHRLPPDLGQWVSGWPAVIEYESAIFCHATPELPPHIVTTAHLTAQMNQGAAWPTFFPRLHRDTEAVWRALAALLERERRVAFHGHTHVQQIWSWTPDEDGHRQLQAQSELTELTLEAGRPEAPACYLIGVGSAGEPQDGPALRYAVYDTEQNHVTLRRLA